MKPGHSSCHSQSKKISNLTLTCIVYIDVSCIVKLRSIKKNYTLIQNCTEVLTSINKTVAYFSFNKWSVIIDT